MHTFSDTVAFSPYKTVSVCVGLVKHTTEKDTFLQYQRPLFSVRLKFSSQ